VEGLTCVIDWPGTMSFIKDLIISCAAVFTAWVAYKGISKWRHEEAGKADADLARRVGKAVYRLRDDLKQARRPRIGNEYPSGFNPEDQSKLYETWELIINNRWAPVSKSANDLESLSNEAEALWGKEIVAPIRALLDCCEQLYAAMGFNLQQTRKEIESQSDGTTYATTFVKEMNDKLFDITQYYDERSREANPNELTDKIGNAVEKISTYVRSKMLHRAKGH